MSPQTKFPLILSGLLLVFNGIEHDLITAAITSCFNDSFKDLVGGSKNVDFLSIDHRLVFCRFLCEAVPGWQCRLWAPAPCPYSAWTLKPNCCPSPSAATAAEDVIASAQVPQLFAIPHLFWVLSGSSELCWSSSYQQSPGLGMVTLN